MSIGNSNFGFSGGGGSTPPPATTEWLLDGNTVGSQKYFGTNDNYSIPIYTNGVARGIFTSTGNFGFGMVLPTARVHIQGSDSTLFNYGLKIDNSSSSPMLYVANNGYIGMGIAVPTARLDIVGVGNTSSTSSLNIQNSSLSPLLYVGDDGGIGFGTSTPASSSILDLTSTTRGLLAPRMTTLERDAISSPANGLFIYNTSSSFFNYWNGSTWIQVDTSTGGDVSGSGTTNYAVMWTDGGNSVVGNSTWYYSTNDYLPVTSGSNIGDDTHRIGTIFMASVFDYSNNLTWVNSASTKMTLSTAGNLGVGITSSSSIRVNIQGSDATSSNYSLQALNSSSANIALFRNDGIINFGNASQTNQRLVRIGQGTTSIDLGSYSSDSTLATIYMNASTPSTTNYAVLGTSTSTNFNAPTTQLNLRIADSNRVSINLTQTNFSSGIASSGALDVFNFTTPASTNQTLSTETIGVRFNMSATIQHATGALTTQRDFVIDARTHSFVGASTITDAATLYITGAPIAGTNATITNAMSLWIPSGNVNIGTAARTGQRLLRIGQDTAIVDIGSIVGASNVGGIYFGGSTPALNNYGVGGTTGLTVVNSLTTIDLRIGGVVPVYQILTNRHIWTPNASASAASDVFTFTTPASTNQTATTETIGVRFNMSASIQHATGAITLQRDFVIDSRTHTFVGASTITDAATLYITGAPIAGTNATITNAMSLWIPSGNVNIGTAARTGQRLLRIGQDTAIVDIGSRVASTAQGAIYLSQTTPSNTNYNIAGDSTFSIINSPLAVANTNAVYIAHASTLNYTFFPNRISFTPTATVSGATDVFNFTTPASTNQTLSTETIGVRFNMSASIQHATGAITTQRDFVIDARTHSFVGASTITAAATLAISAAPIAGTNATITNGYALWLQSGSMLISSGILSVSAPTASNTGATVFTSSTTLTGTNSQNPNGMAFVHSGTGFGSTIYYGIGVQNRSSSALSAGMGVGILMGLGYGAGSFVNTRITSYAIGTVSSSLDSAFGIQTSIGGTVAERFTFYKESFGINTTTPNSYLQINGSVSTAYVQKTASYVLTSSDFTVECTSGTFDITLPTAVGILGRIYVIDNSGAGTITLATTSSQTIDGNASGVLTLTQNKSYTVQSNNSNWVIIAVK